MPTRVKINTGPSTIDNRVAYSGFYAQDQWTLKRLTLSGGDPLRPRDQQLPGNVHWQGRQRTRLAAATNPMCPCRLAGRLPGSAVGARLTRTASPTTTSRRGGPWRGTSFGTGKTSVKWNMGKYLAGAGIAGIYADANPAQRTVNMYTRTWTDVNGNRRVDCDLLNFNAQNVAGRGHLRRANLGRPAQDSTRYGRDPLSLDARWYADWAGDDSVRTREAGIPADVQAYCDVYGDSLLDGWGKRRSEWQFGLGIQHELLPRFSAEFTYNRRSYSNLTVTDQLGIGCDRFNGRRTCRRARTAT